MQSISLHLQQLCLPLMFTRAADAVSSLFSKHFCNNLGNIVMQKPPSQLSTVTQPAPCIHNIISFCHGKAYGVSIKCTASHKTHIMIWGNDCGYKYNVYIRYIHSPTQITEGTSQAKLFSFVSH